jgi:hypothetical protein
VFASKNQLIIVNKHEDKHPNDHGGKEATVLLPVAKSMGENESSQNLHVILRDRVEPNLHNIDIKDSSKQGFFMWLFLAGIEIGE